MSLVNEVEKLFEELREKLVNLVGDIHGVHATVDDAKASIGAHVPSSSDDATQAEGTDNVEKLKGEKGGDGNSNPEAGTETKTTVGE